jgi:hypothetical protein
MPVVFATIHFIIDLSLPKTFLRSTLSRSRFIATNWA